MLHKAPGPGKAPDSLYPHIDIADHFASNMTEHTKTDGLPELALLPGEKLLVSGSKESGIRRWDPASRVGTAEQKIVEGVDAWRYSPTDSHAVIAARPDGSVVQWRGENLDTMETLLNVGPGNSVKFADRAPWLAAIAAWIDERQADLAKPDRESRIFFPYGRKCKSMALPSDAQR